MEITPLALVIEDTPMHATIAEVLLGELGFQVEVATSVQAGAGRAYDLLDPRLPAPQALILLDLKLPDPRIPSLEGSALAAQLAEAMEQGRLHPAHLVAIT